MKSRTLLAPALAAVLFISAPHAAIGNSAFRTPHSALRVAGQYDEGAAALGQALTRLGVVAGVLHTGAHPDDEASGLLAYLARGRQARTAYLSLTRGDGGQNLIGPELYEALGVIRTEEMLAARRLDGAGQFFSRAFDFGFTKSRDEALARWGDVALADIVRVIRTFRPDVIVSAWTGTPSDGHGHHQAAGALTIEAFRAAADPQRFPEQINAGLRPWQAKKLYAGRGAGNAEQPDPAVLTINTGAYDPLLGRGYYEIAMRGRSLHRSQDQGALERRGPQYTRLRLLARSQGSGVRGQGPELDTAAGERDIFDGIDTTLPGIAARVGATDPRFKKYLEGAQLAADEARRKYNPLAPAPLTSELARGLGEVRAALEYLPSLRLSEAAQAEARFYLQGKERDFINAMVLAAGVVVDFLADDEIVTPGQPFAVSVNAYGITPKSVRFDAPKGWAAVEKKVTSAITPRDMRVAWQADYTVTVPADAAPTQPYWLRQPRRGDAFAPGDGMTGIEPLAPPALRAVVEFDIEGERVAVTRPVQYRYADKALGEVRRDLKVAPAVSVVTAPGILIFPEADAAAAAREVTVTLTNHDRQGSAGKLKLEAPAGWRVTPAEADFALKREGEQASYRFQVNAPAQIAPGNYDLQAVATVGNQPYTIGYQALAYPHIEPRWVYRPAKVVAEVFDVKVAPDLRVGYVEGAGDGFDEALRRLGVNVQTVTPAELAAGDLSRYDCIVLGVRVYEVRPDVIANNARLLDYARRGGVLIAQYNKAEYAAGNFAPYPVKMARTPDRVTDERAAVTVLDPAHPLFNFPNKITARDFEGWVQERGTYFLNEWDAQYKPLLASNDAGEAPQRGGQLIAPVGEGYYVYTGYAWFRQLPEGVPGAYRLVANLVSFPKAVKRKT